MDVRSGGEPARLLRALCLVAVGFPGTPRPVPARACDSNWRPILTRGQAGLLRRHGFQVDLSFRSTRMSTSLAGTSPVETVVRRKVLLENGEVIPGYHEDREGPTASLEVDAAWGVAESATLFASFPSSATAPT